MSDYTYTTPVSLLNAICSAVREKDGTTESIAYQDLPQRVLDIEVSNPIDVDSIISEMSKNILIYSGSGSSWKASDGSLNIPGTSTSWYLIGSFEIENGKHYCISANQCKYGRFGLSTSFDTIYGYPSDSERKPNITYDTDSPSKNTTASIISSKSKYGCYFTANETRTVYVMFCSDYGTKQAYNIKLQIEQSDKPTDYMQHYDSIVLNDVESVVSKYTVGTIEQSDVTSMLEEVFGDE